jgi:uncharacterized protein YukE
MSEQLGDEKAVDDAAQQLRRASETVQSGGVAIEKRIAETAWSGPMKDRYVQASVDQNQQLTKEATELLDAASRLAHHAQWIRDEKSRLDGLADRIEAWAGANPAGTSKTGQDASLLSALPPRHNFGWDDVANRLRTAGIAF